MGTNSMAAARFLVLAIALLLITESNGSPLSAQLSTYGKPDTVLIDPPGDIHRPLVPPPQLAPNPSHQILDPPPHLQPSKTEPPQLLTQPPLILVTATDQLPETPRTVTLPTLRVVTPAKHWCPECSCYGVSALTNKSCERYIAVRNLTGQLNAVNRTCYDKRGIHVVYGVCDGVVPDIVFLDDTPTVTIPIATSDDFESSSATNSILYTSTAGAQSSKSVGTTQGVVGNAATSTGPQGYRSPANKASREFSLVATCIILAALIIAIMSSWS